MAVDEYWYCPASTIVFLGIVLAESNYNQPLFDYTLQTVPDM